MILYHNITKTIYCYQKFSKNVLYRLQIDFDLFSSSTAREMSPESHQTFNPNTETFYRDDQCTFNTKNAFPVQCGIKEIGSQIKTF